MRRVICIAIVVALAGLTGCGQSEKAPAPDNQSQTDQESIHGEDFESGEAEGSIEEAQEQTEGGETHDSP